METISPQLICTICQEALSRDNDGLLATQCGHLFHKECLAKWFHTNMSMGSLRAIPRDEMLKGSCPVCSTPLWMKRCLKIFPSVDDQEANSIKYHVESLEKTLADAELLIKKQELAIVVLTKPASGSAKVRGSPARFTTPVKRKSVETSAIAPKTKALGLPRIKNTVQEPKSRQTANKATTDQRSGLTMTLRSTTLSQRLVESTPTVRRAAATTRTTTTSRTAATRTPTPSATSSTRRPLPSSASSAPIRRTTASRLVR